MFAQKPVMLIYLKHKHLKFVQIWEFETTRLILVAIRVHQQLLASRLMCPHAT